MERIESQVEPGRLLHVIHHDADFQKFGHPVDSRIDILPDCEGLQVAAIKGRDGRKFAAHKHLPRPREIPITQECWVVVAGVVRVSYYDLDGSFLCHRVLQAGDVTATIAGGHGYAFYTSNTRVVEVKTGPYIGAEGDKELLPA